MFNDNDGFLALNHMTVDLRRVNRDHLLHLLVVLFNDFDSAIKSGLHLHTIYLGGDSLNLRLGRLFSGRLGLLVMSVEVVFILCTSLSIRSRYSRRYDIQRPS